MNKGIPRPMDEAKRLGLIEPEILLLVEAMNSPPLIETIASCQGHPRRHLWGASRAPYVYFRSLVPVAAALERALRSEQVSQHRRLHFPWRVEGTFDQDYNLVFTLHSPFLDVDYPYRIFAPPTGKPERRVIDDFASLTTLVGQVLSVIRDGHRHNIANEDCYDDKFKELVRQSLAPSSFLHISQHAKRICRAALRTSIRIGGNVKLANRTGLQLNFHETPPAGNRTVLAANTRLQKLATPMIVAQPT